MMRPWMGEYTPDKVHRLLHQAWPEVVPAPTLLPPLEVPERPAQMCPGCGHRSAFHAIKAALAEKDITVADIGCHTLGYLPPYEMGQLLMCMGASTAIGSGLGLFNETRRVVAFMGDSTFFHAALPGVINALFNRHNLTLILMENGTTAMTGHQDHAASGRNFNTETMGIPLRQVLEGLGIEAIFEVDTYQQAELKRLVEEALAVPAFSVVIARHPCMLKFTRQQRRRPQLCSTSGGGGSGNLCAKPMIAWPASAAPASCAMRTGAWASTPICVSATPPAARPARSRPSPNPGPKTRPKIRSKPTRRAGHDHIQHLPHRRGRPGHRPA